LLEALISNVTQAKMFPSAAFADAFDFFVDNGVFGANSIVALRCRT
jgi:hypothetical protein